MVRLAQLNWGQILLIFSHQESSKEFTSNFSSSEIYEQKFLCASSWKAPLMHPVWIFFFPEIIWKTIQWKKKKFLFCSLYWQLSIQAPDRKEQAGAANQGQTYWIYWFSAKSLNEHWAGQFPAGYFHIRTVHMFIHQVQMTMKCC